MPWEGEVLVSMAERCTEMKEYGGYLPIDLRDTGEYYGDGYNLIRLNSGRSAIVKAIKDSKEERVWLPWYMCESVRTALDENYIKYNLYYIDKNFMPEDIDYEDNDILIWANYFGLQGDDVISTLIKKYNNIIFDNTQAFYSKPVRAQFNVYSPRKFFGLPDGAYLIGDRIAQESLQRDISYDTSGFLLTSLEAGTNSKYQESLINEKRIEDSGILGMSILTEKLLCNIDYKLVYDKRRENFQKLAEKLGHFNELDIELSEDNCPMVYPFLYKSETLRSKLVSDHIYVPQWWKWIIGNGADTFEEYLAKYLIPLPIDQRYGVEDMDHISEFVIKCIDGGI